MVAAGGRQGRPKMVLQKTHFFDRRTLERLNAAIVFGPVLSGLMACMLGALVYDIGRLFSVW
jgi:hypothetical protein